MIAVKFDADHAPTGQIALRQHTSPIREEWQQDGTWTGLFDPPADADIDEIRERATEVGGDEVQITEIDGEDDIPGFRMALYLFGAVPDVGTDEKEAAAE